MTYPPGSFGINALTVRMKGSWIGHHIQCRWTLMIYVEHAIRKRRTNFRNTLIQPLVTVCRKCVHVAAQFGQREPASVSERRIGSTHTKARRDFHSYQKSYSKVRTYAFLCSVRGVCRIYKDLADGGGELSKLMNMYRQQGDSQNRRQSNHSLKLSNVAYED